MEIIKIVIEEALDRADLKSSHLNQTLLDGVSTRIQVVTEIIKQIMKKAAIKGVNVDEAVSCGAALYAGIQNKSSLNSAQKKAVSQVELNDVCNHYMGTLVYGRDTERNQLFEYNSVVIPRDTKLPCSITKDYYVMADDQQVIDCSVTQSEGEEKDVEFVHVIANEPLQLRKGAKQGDPFKVTYSYDTNGNMHCIFEEVKSKKKKELNLKPGNSRELKELRENLDFDIE